MWAYLLNLKDITGNDLRGLDLLESTITKNNGLQREGLLQFVDNGTSLEFLDETDGSVEQEQTADDTEIDPVLETGSENSSSLKLRMSLANEFHAIGMKAHQSARKWINDTAMKTNCHRRGVATCEARIDFAQGRWAKGIASGGAKQSSGRAGTQGAKSVMKSM